MQKLAARDALDLRLDQSPSRPRSPGQEKGSRGYTLGAWCQGSPCVLGFGRPGDDDESPKTRDGHAYDDGEVESRLSESSGRKRALTLR